VSGRRVLRDRQLRGSIVVLLGLVAMALFLVVLTAQLPDDTVPRESTSRSAQPQ
jgi:hypothetical protein